LTLAVAPQVEELLSDEQLASVEAQVATGEAPCIRCGQAIDPELDEASVVLVVDSGPRRAAVHVSHAGCGPSIVAEAELPGPGEARLAERWAAFVLPRVPLVALQAVAGVWTGEREPALFSMLRGLGFESAREALDSDLFATGVGPAPRASGLTLAVEGRDLELRLDSGETLESLPGIAAGRWAEQVEERGGALIAVGAALDLPSEGGIAFEAVLPNLLERAVAAWVPLAG